MTCIFLRSSHFSNQSRQLMTRRRYSRKPRLTWSWVILVESPWHEDAGVADGILYARWNICISWMEPSIQTREFPLVFVVRDTGQGWSHQRAALSLPAFYYIMLLNHIIRTALINAPMCCWYVRALYDNVYGTTWSPWWVMRVWMALCTCGYDEISS